MPHEHPTVSAQTDGSRIRAILADPNLRFPQRPKLSEDLIVYAMPDGLGIQIRGVVEPVIIRDNQAAEAIQYIHKTCRAAKTVSEVLNEAPASISETAILRSFLTLHARGLIVDAAADRSDPVVYSGDPETKSALFWSRHLGISGSCESAASVVKSIASHSITLFGNGLFCSLLLEALIRSGFMNIVVLNWRNCDMLHGF
jgi:hypothetical protein